MQLSFLPHVAICLALAFLLPSHAAVTAAPAGTIQRVTKQQILASIPPHWDENPVLFLTSPSGKYAAYFMRSQTTPGAGGLGADFCYVEVLDTTAPGAEGRSVWESECLAVSTVNTCALVFSWKGLEVFDGSTSVWHTHDTKSDDQNFLETLQLVDQGDMRILDKGGELAWKASDEPRAANSDAAAAQGQAGAGAGEAFGFGNQPLVDNSPYDSGALKHGFSLVISLAFCFSVAVAMGLAL